MLGIDATRIFELHLFYLLRSDFSSLHPGVSTPCAKWVGPCVLVDLSFRSFLHTFRDKLEISERIKIEVKGGCPNTCVEEMKALLAKAQKNACRRVLFGNGGLQDEGTVR